LVERQSVVGLDVEVVAALLPRLHVAVLHGEGSEPFPAAKKRTGRGSWLSSDLKLAFPASQPSSLLS
jgi:hypothetical protein